VGCEHRHYIDQCVDPAGKPLVDFRCKPGGGYPGAHYIRVPVDSDGFGQTGSSYSSGSFGS